MTIRAEMDSTATESAVVSTKRHRHPSAIFRHAWLHRLVLLWSLGAVAAVVYSATHVEIAYVVAVALISIGGAVAFGTFLSGRLLLNEVITPARAVGVGVVSGLVSIPASLGLEMLAGRGRMFLLVGPIEEASILVVPIVACLLWRDRYLNPRAGIAIVLASAGVFAAGEAVIDTVATTFKLHDPLAKAMFVDFHQSALGSLLHMTVTGFAAAMIWREWSSRGRPVMSLRVALAVVAAMALHSANDLAAAGARDRPWLAVVSPAVLILSYWLFRREARETLPQESASQVPPRWRPQPAE